MLVGLKIAPNSLLSSKNLLSSTKPKTMLYSLLNTILRKTIMSMNLKTFLVWSITIIKPRHIPRSKEN